MSIRLLFLVIPNLCSFSLPCFAVIPLLAVLEIRKRDIQEIKAMKNPPPVIKMAVESICLLLGDHSTDWRQILTTVMKDTFVPSILNFNTDEIT